MGWFILAHLLTALLGLIGLGRRSENEKDLEILILRHQLNIETHKQQNAIKFTWINIDPGVLFLKIRSEVRIPTWDLRVPGPTPKFARF
jgi:hypothetical protein